MGLSSCIQGIQKRRDSILMANEQPTFEPDCTSKLSFTGPETNWIPMEYSPAQTFSGHTGRKHFALAVANNTQQGLHRHLPQIDSKEDCIGLPASALGKIVLTQ